MRHVIIVLALLNCGLAMATPACDEPATLAISDDTLSKRQERRLKRDVLRYLRRIERYSSCVQNEYRAARAAGASEAELTALVAAHNETVGASKELVQAYEARIGPVEELASLYAPRQRYYPAPYRPSMPADSVPIGPNGPPPAPGSVEWGEWGQSMTR